MVLDRGNKLLGPAWRYLVDYFRRMNRVLLSLQGLQALSIFFSGIPEEWPLPSGRKLALVPVPTG